MEILASRSSRYDHMIARAGGDGTGEETDGEID